MHLMTKIAGVFLLPVTATAHARPSVGASVVCEVQSVGVELQEIELSEVDLLTPKPMIVDRFDGSKIELLGYLTSDNNSVSLTFRISDPRNHEIMRFTATVERTNPDGEPGLFSVKVSENPFTLLSCWAY